MEWGRDPLRALEYAGGCSVLGENSVAWPLVDSQRTLRGSTVIPTEFADGEFVR